MMLPNELTLNLNAFQVRNYSSLAALVFLILEYFSNCHSEYKHIWRGRPTASKYIYLISRYGGLMGLIVHYTLIHVFLIDVPVKPELCKIWFLFLFATCGITVASLDAILLLRVYALYRKDAKVHILALPLTLQFVAASIVMERVTHSIFSSHCDKMTSPIEIGLMGGSVLLTHAALWMATFAKRNIAEGRAVVVQLVVSEGAWIIFILVCIVITASTYTAMYSTNPFAIFVWPTALMSVITCRIILNMQKLRIESPQRRGGLDSTELRLSYIESNSCCSLDEDI